MKDQIESLYDCLSVIQQADELAEHNNGELPEDAMEAIVKAHTTSIGKLRGLVGYIKYCDGQEMICKAEVARIQAKAKTYANRTESIKQYLLPWVIAEKERTGKNTEVGTFTLGTRKSQSVELDEGFADMNYCEAVTVIKPDKRKIKEFLKANPKLYILGATLKNNQNLSIR